MKILIDIIHPAHVHFFRNAISLWSKNNEVMITSREKDVTIELLDQFNIPHKCISKIGNGLGGLFMELVTRDYRLYQIAKKFKPDVLIGIAGVAISHVGKLIGKPSIVFYDTEFAKLSNSITYPFASVICTPECYWNEIGAKHLRYPGYHELAYLHPNRFEPSDHVVRELGLLGRKFFILRFVSWQASHDTKEKGVSLSNKIKLVEFLSSYGKVLISSESPLPKELEPYKISIGPHLIHHLMAYATIIIGESATMASEAAMLGVPSIYIAKTGRGYTNQLQESYELVYNFKDTEFDLAIKKIDEILNTSQTDLWKNRRNRMLEEKIDVTEFIYNFVQQFPFNKTQALELVNKK